MAHTYLCNCGSPIHIRRSRQCGRCYQRDWRTRHPGYHQQRYTPAPQEQRTCDWCSESFTVYRSSTVDYCSPQCRQQLRRAARHGLRRNDIDALLKQQQHTCPICATELTPAAVIDHCHDTGRVRGILCNACNRGMGLLGDDISRLQAAIAFLNSANGDPATVAISLPDRSEAGCAG